MWTPLAQCPDKEFDALVAALGEGKLVARGEPIGSAGISVDIGSEWWPPRRVVRVEYADGIRMVERNGVCTPLVGVTIVDRVNSTVWQNRISSPRVGFLRIEYRDVNGAVEPLNREAALRRAIQENRRGKDLANRVCELCRVKRNEAGFGVRRLQMLAKTIREE
jgi:hypothetical protein